MLDVEWRAGERLDIDFGSDWNYERYGGGGGSELVTDADQLRVERVEPSSGVVHVVTLEQAKPWLRAPT